MSIFGRKVKQARAVLDDQAPEYRRQSIIDAAAAVVESRIHNQLQALGLTARSTSEAVFPTEGDPTTSFDLLHRRLDSQHDMIVDLRKQNEALQTAVQITLAALEDTTVKRSLHNSSMMIESLEARMLRKVGQLGDKVTKLGLNLDLLAGEELNVTFGLQEAQPRTTVSEPAKLLPTLREAQAQGRGVELVLAPTEEKTVLVPVNGAKKK